MLSRATDREPTGARSSLTCAACSGFTVDPSIPVLPNGGGLNKPGPCVICRQNDPSDHQWPIDVLYPCALKSL